ncbi:MAG: Aldehyde reductase YahK [Chlamydiae bacterium]|nr:Aldehyde reductase YahK [Chlamydiota bacterium]
MIECIGYGAKGEKQKLTSLSFPRRDLRDNDVLIDIKYCGVCHSDIHQVNNDWGGSLYPMVPGHEIVGIVKEVGSNVRTYKKGDVVGVGCLVDSCQECPSCKENLEQYCDKGAVGTYNSKEYESGAATQGGYSTSVVVREEFVVRVPENLDLAAAAPLLCAGITTYSPIKHWKMEAGHKLGVVGLGGLGHMAVKLARAMSINVTVFTTSPEKVDDAKKLGADHVVLSKNEDEMKAMAKQLDFVINTVAAVHNLDSYLQCLKRDGKMIMIGLPDKPYPNIEVSELIFHRKTLAGSLIGGIKETQEMLDFCGEHDIVCDIEKINIQDINEAYKRTIEGDVKYRFVIDIASLKEG